MKLIVGLGNPGREYAKTRHNAGFMVLDLLAGRAGFAFESKFAGRFARGGLRGDTVGLLAPLTYMNLSGRSVLEAAQFYKVAPADILMIADDINLPLGALRLRENGSPGGHNGLKDIVRALGTPEVPRLRIGVGPFTGRDSSGFVLGEFRPDEMRIMEPVFRRAAEAAEHWVEHGIAAAANRYNGPAPESEEGKNATSV